MKNSKLVSLLSKLSQKEFKEFGKFVKSPYFNSNSNIIKLFELIAKYFPEFDNPNLTKENIYKYIYPGEKYNDSTVRGLLSAALKLGEEFLAHEMLRNDVFRYSDLMLTQLCYKGIHDLFYTNIKSLRADIDNLKADEEDYYFIKYRIEHLVNSIESKSYVPLTQRDIPGDVNTKDSDNLLIYFFITILKRYNYLLTKTGSLNIKLDLKFFDEIIGYLGKADLQNTPLLNYHYTRAMLYRSGMDKKYYFELKKILQKNFDSFMHEDIYNILGNLQNYLVYRMRVADEDLSEEQYELYKFAMEKNVLTFDDIEYIHPVLYSNITGTMVTLKKYDEAKQFIEKYKERLDPERKDTAVNFNMAKIYFAEGKFDDALTSISHAHQEDVFYKVAIKGLYALIYYEKEYIEELILHLEAYRSFLNSNEIINQSLKANHANFVAFLSKLIKLKDIKDKPEFEYLKHEIQNEPSVLYKQWLIEKIDALLK